ncbi:MAG TPA: hypothetical protein VLF43_02670 [Candidatus Saccharimonadales bacterium]|nr:hypothetical protein [Candidatus Saccharimonadales bacterium]
MGRHTQQTPTSHNNGQLSVLDRLSRLRHQPRHGYGRRFGALAVEKSGTIAPTHAPERPHPETRPGASRLQRVAAASSKLLGRHITGKGAQRTQQAPKAQIVPDQPKAVGVARVPAPTVAEKIEEAHNRTELVMLKGTSMQLDAQKPVKTRSEVQEEYGVNVGQLQGVVHYSGSAEPLLCFDDSTYDARGNKQGNYYILTPSQLQTMRTSYETKDHKGVANAWEGTVHLNDTNPRYVISPDHPMPGVRVPSNRTLRDYDPNSETYFDITNANASLRGGLELQMNRYGGQLNVGDLDNPNGIIVEFNPQRIDADDPWEGSKAGTYADPEWQARQRQQSLFAKYPINH